jgi:RNA polymerase sigma-70 factor (ECF subfamily)
MRAYQDMVFSTAARLAGNDAQAQDVAQEVFLKAYEHFAQLRSSPAAGGWLKTVATNLTLNYVSRHRKRWRFFSEFRPAGDQHDDQNDDSHEPAAVFALPETLLSGIDAAQRHALIEQALQRLPDHQRLPLVLYHFEEMSYQEISQRLHITLAKVKIDILRARTALARSLVRSGITSVNET